MIHLKRSLGAITFADPLPVWLIATYDTNNKPNMMAAGAGAVCNTIPPCLLVSLREVTHTHKAIHERKAFTINIPGEDHWREADYAGMVSGRDTDKFTDLGFTPVISRLVDAPIIEECPVNIECRLREHVRLSSHTMFIGEVMDVKVDESIFEDGKPEVSRIKPIIFSPRWKWKSSGYYSLGARIGDAYSQRKPPKDKAPTSV